MAPERIVDSNAHLARFNMPVTDGDHAANAVRAAMEMHRRLEEGSWASLRSCICMNGRIDLET